MLNIIGGIDNIFEGESDLKFNINSNSGDSCKIMTIHKSKGLEYHICYFAGFSYGFNISDLNDRFMFSEKYGIIGFNLAHFKYLDENKKKILTEAEVIEKPQYAIALWLCDWMKKNGLKSEIIQNNDGIFDSKAVIKKIIKGKPVVVEE